MIFIFCLIELGSSSSEDIPIVEASMLGKNAQVWRLKIVKAEGKGGEVEFWKGSSMLQ